MLLYRLWNGLGYHLKGVTRFIYHRVAYLYYLGSNAHPLSPSEVVLIFGTTLRIVVTLRTSQCAAEYYLVGHNFKNRADCCQWEF